MNKPEEILHYSAVPYYFFNFCNNIPGMSSFQASREVKYEVLEEGKNMFIHKGLYLLSSNTQK